VNTVSLIVGQVRHQVRLVSRNRLLLFFTFALPLLLFFMFQIVITGDIVIGDRHYSVPQFFGPSLAGYGVVTGTYSYLAVSTAFARQEGILKRLRGTPLPAWVYVAGRIGSALVIAAFTSSLLLVITVVFYDLHIAVVAIPAIVVTFVIGAIAFGALGLAVAAFAPNGDAAVAIANATLLPAAFVSSVFIPLDNPSTLVRIVGSLLPLKPFSLAFQQAVHADSFAGAFAWGRLLVIVLWGLGGIVLGLRYFSWEPRPPRSQRRPSRASAQPPATAPSVRT
jgi:ABC-2 type transport system permease protein